MNIQSTKFEPGDRVTLNRLGDLWMDADSRPFIGAECQVLKVTKAGLIQVALSSDTRKTYSAAKSNVTRI